MNISVHWVYFCLKVLFAITVSILPIQTTLAQSTLRFNDPNPVLETGAPLSQGSRYRFRNVTPGVDSLETVTTVSNATLVSIDTVPGIYDRFEPTIRTTRLNQQRFVQFDFQIAAAGASTQMIVPEVFVTTKASALRNNKLVM